uniref:Uncharacterized protein n=1 Tax=Arundo donax TaxID=35708 RepID=A0A0A8YB85_ARUDO
MAKIMHGLPITSWEVIGHLWPLKWQSYLPIRHVG